MSETMLSPPPAPRQPSRADIAITGRLKIALSIVEVRTLEHLIVAGNDVISPALFID